MKKIISYKTKLDENNKWHFVAITTEQDIIDEILDDYYDLTNVSAKTLNEIVKDFMAKEEIEIAKSEYMLDQKADLSYVRTQMRNIIRRLSNEQIPMQERKDYLDIATSITQSANVITKSVSLELACDKAERFAK